MIPTLIVESDYDGYFEQLVRSWIALKAVHGVEFKHSKVRVTAGPYRSSAVTAESNGDEIHLDFYSSSAVTAESNGDEIHLDFYSALRNGFGSLSQNEIDSIIELL